MSIYLTVSGCRVQHKQCIHTYVKIRRWDKSRPVYSLWTEASRSADQSSRKLLSFVQVSLKAELWVYHEAFEGETLLISKQCCNVTFSHWLRISHPRIPTSWGLKELSRFRVSPRWEKFCLIWTLADTLLLYCTPCRLLLVNVMELLPGKQLIHSYYDKSAGLWASNILVV